MIFKQQNRKKSEIMVEVSSIADIRNPYNLKPQEM